MKGKNKIIRFEKSIFLFQHLNKRLKPLRLFVVCFFNAINRIENLRRKYKQKSSLGSLWNLLHRLNSNNHYLLYLCMQKLLTSFI